MKIGVAISTYKRAAIFKKTYAQWKKYLPDGAVLIVVSDADDKPPKEANFVFKERAGYIDWKHPEMFDMGVFNYVAAQYPKKIHGAPVNTVFKKYDLTNERCWFAHK